MNATTRSPDNQTETVGLMDANLSMSSDANPVVNNSVYSLTALVLREKSSDARNTIVKEYVFNA